MLTNDTWVCWFTDGLQRICKEEGVMSLWSGTGPSLVLAGNPAIQFMVYEGIKKFLMTEDNKVSASVTSSLLFSYRDILFIGDVWVKVEVWFALLLVKKQTGRENKVECR